MIANLHRRRCDRGDTVGQRRMWDRCGERLTVAPGRRSRLQIVPVLVGAVLGLVGLGACGGPATPSSNSPEATNFFSAAAAPQASEPAAHRAPFLKVRCP